VRGVAGLGAAATSPAPWGARLKSNDSKWAGTPVDQTAWEGEANTRRLEGAPARCPSHYRQKRTDSQSGRTQRRGFGDRIGEEEGLTIAKSQSSLDFETIAQEVSSLGQRVSDLETRIEHVEKVNTGLEEAALTTARALQEISSHWDKVYEAIRRRETTGDA
jgi:hypothetical protein